MALTGTRGWPVTARGGSYKPTTDLHTTLAARQPRDRQESSRLRLGVFPPSAPCSRWPQENSIPNPSVRRGRNAEGCDRRGSKPPSLHCGGGAQAMISSFFINRPVVAMVIAIITVIGGLVAMRGLPVAQFPDIVPPQILVTTTFPGADAVTIEQSVATPLGLASDPRRCTRSIKSSGSNGRSRSVHYRPTTPSAARTSARESMCSPRSPTTGVPRLRVTAN